MAQIYAFNKSQNEQLSLLLDAKYNSLWVRLFGETPAFGCANDGEIAPRDRRQCHRQMELLQHPNGMTTLHAHCHAIVYVGSAGDSTGYHLHWAATINGGLRDPFAE